MQISDFSASIESVVIVDDRNGTENFEDVPRPEIEVIENARSVIRCLVNGGFPIPTIEVFLNEENITDDFRLSIRSNAVGTRGLRLIHRHYEALASDFVARTIDHRASLQCVAHVPGLSKVTANALINVLCEYFNAFHWLFAIESDNLDASFCDRPISRIMTDVSGFRSRPTRPVLSV